MKGRAGRKGRDDVGETYLCCNKNDLEVVAQLIEAELPVVQSCLAVEKPGLQRYVWIFCSDGARACLWSIS